MRDCETVMLEYDTIMDLDDLDIVFLSSACVLAGTLFFWIKRKGMEYIIIHYRWVFVCLFLLPLSVLYDIMMYVRAWLIFKMNSAPKMHDTKVKHVQSQVNYMLCVHKYILSLL